MEDDELQHIMSKAEDGDAESQFTLAEWYMDGENGLDEDPVKAVEWLTKAAAQGSSAAMVSLGQMQEGRHNLEEAEKWYRKALVADSECRDAELNLKLLGLSSFERLIKTTLLENEALDRFIREESWEQANKIVEELRATYSRRPDRAQISYYCCLDQKTHYLEIMLDDCPYRMRDKAFVSWIRYHLMITHGDLSPEEQIVLNEHIWRSQQGERGPFISPYSYITSMGPLIYELERPYVTLTWMQAITPWLTENFKKVRDEEDYDAEYWNLRAALVASDVIYAHLVAKHFPSDSSCTESVNEIEGFVNAFDNPIDEWSENELNLIDFFIKSIIPLYEENGLRESLVASWKVASTFYARTMRVKLAEKYESLIKSALES